MDYDMSQKSALVERGESFSQTFSFAPLLKESPGLCRLINEIDMDQWSFDVAANGEDAYNIDLEEGVVTLPAKLKQGAKQHAFLLNAIRALRDIWYEDNHFDMYEILRPDELLKWERIRSADLETFTVYVAWELRIAGHQALWRYLMGTDMGDMAMIFQAIMDTQTGTGAAPLAMLHAFRQWHMGEDRLNDTDSMTLSALDDIVLSSCEQEPFGDARIHGSDLEARITYLKETEQMLSSPEFCVLPSDINETHLFHIMSDLETIQVQGVRFRDKGLAAKLFPTNT